MAPPRGKYQTKLNAVMYAMMLEDLLEGPSTAQELADYTGMSILTVQRTLRVMHRRGVIHVAAWNEDMRGAWTLRSFALGRGKDAKKPPPKTRAQYEQNRRDRLRTAAVGPMYGSLLVGRAA
jgi:hypothetical protein